MSNQEQPKSQKRHRAKLLVALVVAFLLVTTCLARYRLRFFSFHANVSPVGGIVAGEVFRSSDGVFLVRLNSGSQLTVQTNPLRAFLSPKSSPSGFRLGDYLIVPAVSVGGVDLSKSESFDRLVPVVGEGKITLKDPMQRDSGFFFPY